MDLIERYLQAVKHWLPTKTERTTSSRSCQRTFTPRSRSAKPRSGARWRRLRSKRLLLERGRPMLVASGYLPQEYLIGPELFPVYRFVLKIVLLCSGAPTGTRARQFDRVRTWRRTATRRVPGSPISGRCGERSSSRC